MMPGSVLSTTTIQAQFLAPDDVATTHLVDFELGGIALQNPAQGLQFQVWTFVLDAADGVVWVFSPNTPTTMLFIRPGTTEISGTFDQNMNPCVAFMQNGVMNLYWFDTVSHSQVFTSFAGNCSSPKVSLDDKRRLENGTSDIIFAYLRDGTLYFCAQRDRFSVEYPLAALGTNYTLRKIGMNKVNRMQFELSQATA